MNRLNSWLYYNKQPPYSGIGILDYRETFRRHALLTSEIEPEKLKAQTIALIPAHALRQNRAAF